MSASILAVFISGLPAQDFRATISGQVTDATGAALAGARVKAVQRNTNQAIERETNADGFYTLTYLQPSTYDVEVTREGFRKSRREAISLLVAEKLELSFTLEVGQVTQEVTVTSGPSELIQTADASGGLNFDSLMTSEYALNGRQVYMMMDLTPGVLFTQEEFGATGFSGTRGWDVNSNFTMSGGKVGTNSFGLNGAPISLTGQFQLAPNVDAIQEFKVMTNTYDASLGRTGGGSVNTTVKSGSNAWHGNLSEYMRNNVLDANYTQLNAAGKRRGKHIVNQFSGTIGGPIRRNKDFIFVSFEGWRERVPFPVVADTPPLDLRDGQHFSKYNSLIYDPLTSHPCVNGSDVPGTCSTSYIRDQFPGNVIPPSRFSPIGQKILGFYPTQNYPGTVDNYVAGTGGKYRYEQPMARWDHAINDHNRLYTLFTFQDGSEYRNQTGIPGPAASGNIYSRRRNINIITDWTRILSPSAIFDLRVSFGRYGQRFPNVDGSSGVTAESLGMTQMIHAPTSTVTAPPRIAIDQFANLFGNGANLQTWRAENQWNIVPTVTMTSGAKTFRFGVDLLYAMQGQGDIGLANGYLQFTRGGTWRYANRTSALNVQDGSGIADVLLGIPHGGQLDWNDTYYRTWPYFGLFIQNDWKVRRNLTLNLGLRYDVQIPWVERWNRANTGFDYSVKNPLSDQIIAKWREFKTAYDRANPRFPYPDAPPAIYGGKSFIQPNGSRRIYATDWTNLQPRIGVAWRFLGATVLRTGFGIYHRTATQAGQTDGFSQTTPYTRSTDGDLFPSAGLTGPYSLQNPFPDGIVQPSGSALGLLTNVGNAVTYDGRQRPIPRTFQYSFGLQRRLMWNILLDASYVGSVTNHDAIPINTDYWGYDFNQAAFALPAFGDTTVNNPFFGILPTNRTRGSGATVQRRELFRQYPLFPNVTNNTMPWGRYRYDSLQMRVDKRFTGGRSAAGELTLVFSYTFSKQFQQANYLNTWNFEHEKPVKELVAYDKPQNISLSGFWGLPFGKGRHFAAHSNKMATAFIGGWRVNWTFRYTSGNPIAGINAQNTCGGALLLESQSHDRWWNNDKSCWKANPSYWIRNVEDRYAWLRQMDNITVNMAAAKEFPLTERWKIQLRGEAFNLANRPIYRPASTTFTDVNFGRLSIEQQNFPRNIQVSAKLTF
ncbi:MAG TPA: TonB-dependent receptor [Bryobacteraceae bacterium]|nr:TonB-dependent receptor [Bryobacteraceae bacterium]